MTTDRPAVALVTGDPGGNAGTLVPHLTAAGLQVLLAHGIGEDEPRLAGKAIQESGGRASAHLLDPADPEAARRLVHHVESELGPLRALVTCAGAAPGESEALAELDRIYRVTRAAVGSFMRHKAGAVVVVTHASGLDGDPDLPLRAAASAGAIGFTLSVAKEYARFGVRANVVLAEDGTDPAPVAAFLLSAAALTVTGQALRARREPGR